MASKTNGFDYRNINRRDVLVGLLAVIILGIIVYIFVKPNTPSTLVTLPTPKAEETVENKFKRDIPDDIEKAELSDVSGGTGSGIATRTEILVDLADPKHGEFYQAWLEKDGKLVSLGKLRMEKGGWIIEYNSAGYPGYNKVIISLESRFDSTMETKVLEGTFK